MKKILILFLLTFPLLIFALVSWSASVIAYYVPLTVESIHTVEGADIESTVLNQTYDLKFQITPSLATNQSFKVYDDEGNLFVDYNHQTKAIETYDFDDAVVRVHIPDNFLVNGQIYLKVETIQHGFSQLTAVTTQGSYEAYSDVYIANPDAEPDQIQGVILNYKNIHSEYRFGSSNDILVEYTYFPKRAPLTLTEEEQLVINERLKSNALLIDFEFNNDAMIKDVDLIETTFGKGILTIRLNEGNNSLKTNNLVKNTMFVFKAQVGYNIYTEDDLRNHLSNERIYLLKEVYLTKWTIFDSIVIEGNGFRLNHTRLPYYNDRNSDGSLMHVGRFAIEVHGNSSINNVYILGPLNEQQQAYENIINLGLIARNDSDREFILTNSIIQNGRFNLTVIGKAHSSLPLDQKATVFNIENIEFIGAAFASIEVDNAIETANQLTSTNVNLKHIDISYTAIGVLIQNSSGGRGKSLVNLYRIHSSSWRNLDDASGALNANNFGYIMTELKSYTDVVYREGNDYFVNPLIMIRGGNRNYSEVIFNDADVFEMLIFKERKPSLIESVHPSIGGSFPFYIYLVNPIYYEEDILV